ncbi:hypothetical protein B0H14DRAFT_3466574 [Mycena olivaceomarginata]|nr:hypothetical protein B0H14DRAFT_3466574 [Mycena olivaceomarginata]
MAETIGTVASIIQLVDTALKAREYTQDFIHAPQEQKDLLKEMEYLRALLEQLSARIADDRNTPSSGILQQMDRPLGDFRLMMTRCNKKLEPGGGPVPKFSKRLTWTLWDKKEAKDYLEKFEQFKSLLNAWLLVDIRDMGQQHHGIVLRSVDNVASLINVQQDTISEQQRQMTLIHGTVLEAVDNVANVVDRNVINIGDTISGHINSAERAQIIDWFSPINFFLRHADVSRARQPGTGRWLLVDPQFMEWESGIGGTLWCYGMRT